MATQPTDQMTDQRRALLTEREREILAGEADVTDNYRYSVESRVRTRLRERLPQDLDVIREYYHEIYDDLLYPMVCQPESGDGTDDAEAGAAESESEPTVPSHTRDATHDAPSADTTPAVSADVRDEIRDEIADAVEAVATSWEDTPDRLETRKTAAAVILQHALDSDDAVGKSSDVVAETRAEFDVNGQNEETYWRKNIRPVLKEYGQYSQSRHGYLVESLDK